MTAPEIDLNHLRSIAEAATPGPWAWCGQDNGTVELRGPGHFGKLDARLISAARAEPCFAEILDPDEDLDADFPETTGAPTPYICDSCKAVWRRYQAGDGDAFDRYRCPKPENTETVWLSEPGHGHIVPINRFVSRQREHRADIEPGVIDHPNAQFIQTFNPATVLGLLGKTETTVHLVASLRRVLENLNWFIRDSSDPGVEALGAVWEATQLLAQVGGQTPKADAPKFLYSLPGGERAYDSPEDCYEGEIDWDEDAQDREWAIEQWTVAPAGRDLPSVDYAIEWVIEHATMETTEDGAEDWEQAAKRDDVKAAFGLALGLLAKHVNYRLCDRRVGTLTVTWDENREPLLDGNPMYGKTGATA